MGGERNPFTVTCVRTLYRGEGLHIVECHRNPPKQRVVQRRGAWSKVALGKVVIYLRRR